MMTKLRGRVQGHESNGEIRILSRKGTQFRFALQKNNCLQC